MVIPEGFEPTKDCSILIKLRDHFMETVAGIEPAITVMLAPLPFCLATLS